MKKKIQEYPNDTWLFTLAVANEAITYQDINKLYCSDFDGNKEIDVKEDVDLTPGGALTTFLYKRKTHEKIVLVWYGGQANYSIANKIPLMEDLVNACAHEALHVAIDTVCACCNDKLDVDNQETLAYLAGWTAQNIFKTLR